jgi:predicted 3-demethylubiquinone-9 3-methyltransferase (glyoxalase superfamily)
MQKMSTCLWFDNQAGEAMDFYLATFKNSSPGDVSRYGKEAAAASGQPEGSVLMATFQLEGREFMALNGGPAFKFTPAVSFFVNCQNSEEITELWQKLSEGGNVLMELNTYPFSEKYGWLNDKFGVSWQLNLAARPQKINPFLMFTGEQYGKAEEAMNFYTTLFDNSAIINIHRYSGVPGEPDGNVVHGVFSLNGQEYMAMESNQAHNFTFTPATSFVVPCQTQEEVDRLWFKLSEGGREDRCGWLADRYGLSWQIVPTILGKLMQSGDKEKSGRVAQAMFKMKKLEIDKLQEAYDEEN